MKKRMYVVLLFGIVMFMFAACSNNDNENNESNNSSDILTESGMPIVNEPITLNFMAGKSSPRLPDDYNDSLIWQEYEDMTDIHIDWQIVPSDGLEEKRNLELASDNLPDVFYATGLPTGDLLKYGQQGKFVALNDLIDENMPNLKQVFEESPEIEKGLTFPDGNIYSLPTIFDEDFTSGRLGMTLWIREDWLAELDMDVPETTDEFYDYLKAVKETDLIGDDSGDEIPYGAHNIAGIRDVIKGAFGVGNKGHGHQFIDLDPDTEEVRFFPITDQYKEMLTYLNKLYDEKLIQENIFTIETEQSFAMGSDGLYGSVVISNPETVYGDSGDKFIGVPPLEGPNGDRMVSRVGSTLSRVGEFAITESNEYPEATLRWMDHFYSDEGTKMFFMGIEGETYEEEDGELDYVDSIKDHPEGLEHGLADYVTWLGGSYPGYVKEDYFRGAETLPSSIDAGEKNEPYIGEIWPSFLYTDEESKEMDALKADIEKYVNEMTEKFIAGSEPLSKWDDYVERIKSMGFDRYMEIQNEAYQRFKDS